MSRKIVKLLLAHELRSEALRILIPAVTAYTEDRLASFKALLLAGIAQSYGGDPDDLAVVTDSMPEPGSDVRSTSSCCTTPCPAAPAISTGSRDPTGCTTS
ncbi:hypothetical protein [Streptomyces sp. NBC_01363]|uniref:hypothetical protein n=1 Tax=Streptomyces sp. NBC_01363 TaxID=2903840 RepID=UPI00225BA9BA|nr:hypothetical protein [Streptomyces sp. NBC_01363]MCX4735480.1 hypothetical protein [Streptomyces sp. NBC_01363]